MRIVSAALLLLALAGPAGAKGTWRNVEVTLSDEAVNDAIAKQRRSAQYRDPGTGDAAEGWKAIQRSLAKVSQARLGFEPGQIRLTAVVSVITGSVVFVDFDLQPRVVAPNVVELVGRGGSVQWNSGRPKELDPGQLSSYMGKLAKEVEGRGVKVGFSSGRPPRLRFDLRGLPALKETQLLALTPGDGTIKVRGRTTLERVTTDIGADSLNGGFRLPPELPTLGKLMTRGEGRIDVGRENPGRLTISSKSKLPWLPGVPYKAVLRVERNGPHSLRLAIENVVLGKPGLDRLLRRRATRPLRRFVMKRVYAKLDQVEAELARAYARGRSHVRVSHDPKRPHVRVIHLRPGHLGSDVAIGPGFELETVSVRPGAIRVTAALSSSATPAAPRSSANRKGMIGAIQQE